MESDAAEAEDGVAGGVGLGYSNVVGKERVLERVDAFLGVFGHHGETICVEHSATTLLQLKNPNPNCPLTHCNSKNPNPPIDFH